MATQGSRIEKINKLLAKARDPATTEEESLSYFQYATKLMARHQIDQDMLDATAGKTGDIIEIRVDTPEPFSNEKMLLAQYLAVALHCRCVYFRHRETKRVEFVVVMGKPGDVERVEKLYGHVWLQALQGVSALQIPPFTLVREETYRSNWINGYALMVGQRILDIEAHIARENERTRTRTATGYAEGPKMSTALVIKSKEGQVHDYYTERFDGHTVKEPVWPPTRADAGATAGAIAGTRADIGITGVES